jgi:hypothetical protein
MGIALGVAVLVVIVGLGLGARDVVLDQVLAALPVDVIEVVPRRMSVGVFEVGTADLLGGTALDDATLGRLRALPGVAAAYPKLEVKVPMGARGGARFFGRNLYADLFMTGLPAELLAAEVGDDFRDEPGVVPVVVSDQLLEIYNASVAPGLGLPRMSGDVLKGFEFDIVLGRSLMLGERGGKKVGVERARLMGVSRYAIRLGVTVPIETARRILAQYGDADAGDVTYASILLRARSPADVPAITSAVAAAGLAVDETAARTSDILAAATALASLVGLLILALAALNIAHSFFASLSERRRELAVLRAVGAHQLHLVLLVEAQALLLGAFGGLGGLGLGAAAAWGLDLAARRWLPDFPFKPETFFVLPLWLFGVALTAAVVAALAGALWPAVRAARASVAQGLGDG